MAVESIKSAAASAAMKPVEVVKPVTIEPVAAAVAEPNVAVKEVQGSASNNANEGNGEGRERQASKGQIKSAVSQANSRLRKTGCQFSYHEATKRVSITIVDKETNEVIKEIPPEETLEMVEKMWELAGILVDEKR